MANLIEKVTKQQWTSKPINKFLYLQSKPVTSSLYLSQARHRVRQQTEKTGRKGINRAVSNNSTGNLWKSDSGWISLPHPLNYSNRAPYIWIQLRTIPEIQCSLLLKWRMSGNSTKQQAVAISQGRITLFIEQQRLSFFVNKSHCKLREKKPSGQQLCFLLNRYHFFLYCSNLWMISRCCGLPLNNLCCYMLKMN